MKLKLILTLCLSFLMMQAHAYKEQNLEITVNGQKRSMICYTPNAMTRNMPLFIITHGMNQDPVYQRDNDKFYQLVDTAKFVITYLKSDGNTWDIGGQKDLNFVKETITTMNKVYGIDKKRVYWAGFSMGSMLIYHGIGSGMADYIAAFAPCSGVAGEPWKSCKKPINLIHCHSKNDDVFPIANYKPRDFAAHFVDIDKCTEYKKWTNASLPGGWDTGDKERWWNGTNGTEVEIFMCNSGGHWPTQGYIREIWGFCKRFSLDNYKTTYNKTYKEATQLIEDWGGMTTLYTGLKTPVSALQKCIEANCPDSINTADTLATKTAIKKLETNIKKVVDAAEKTMKTSKRVTKTDFDPNFHIYLCFGQSNMEGNAIPQLEDYGNTSDRFLMMAPVAMSSYGRTKNNWYMARPPLCRDNTGLTPADYFGKTLVKNLPDSISVGVINVSLGGCAIEMFNEDGIADYIKKQADWLQGYAKSYNNNPFRYLIDAAKKAQQVGVIKGILLHQGCSNNTQQDWPQKVKVIYERMLSELGLTSDECPLLVGELLAQNQGGVCYGHNSVIAKVPSVISNSYVVSSSGCTGATDGLHFTSAGYRKIGENYAKVMLKQLERYIRNTSFSIKSMKPKQTTISMSYNSKSPVYIMLTDASGVEHDVTASCQFTCLSDKIRFDQTNVISADAEGDYTVVATYVNDEGKEISTEFTVAVRLFPLTPSAFNPSLIKSGTFTVSSSSNTFKGAKEGMGGWHFDTPVDLSDKDSLIFELKSTSLAKPELRIYDVDDLSSTSYYSLPLSGAKHFAVDLKDMKDANGNRIDPSHIYTVGVAVQTTSAVYISNVYVCGGEETSIRSVAGKEADNRIYDLNGRLVATPQKKGVYVRNGKKFVVK